MRTYTIKGFYGDGRTPCNVLIAQNCIMTWYAIPGSVNVSGTYETLEDGVNVESVIDSDSFTASFPIETEEDLQSQILD